MIRLIVGLGNPGPEYEQTRHNAGFWWVDAVARELKVHLVAEKGYFGNVARANVAGQPVWLLEPMTYMNRSGQAVAALARFFKIAPDEVLVVHDELDLAPGKCRIKQGGGHAGHNGLRSISGMIGEGYGRVRLGIGHPGHKDAVAAYVLHDFAKVDQDWLDDLLRGVSDGAVHLAAGEGQKFMNAVALRTAPPRSSDKPKPEPKPATAEPAPDARTPMQKLLDRFR